ncbi:Sec-independent protein translocase TatB [Microbacterium sp. cx-55]|uniref:Sec-independent protein translocase TatB n=1 Tax=unclassified Microbacterium TaxID=2609290 RepID=UPI001CBC20C0|nr:MULTISPECIES: Sec-independent protein translocase TatB [unclassified Microbacterium]MBZ4485906.1 Sec-independent protein translocase TatB [Microbacterium sp. cx-55]MCC4906867.1 Sec-independent protein translocase TatB [Microbacterium sp. cx-59]UGB34218.1 Sec-independent protein translocase TatB [Microbacterium sp. cx-55]
MFFGLTIEKLLLIGVIAALLIGPERLPGYAEALARATARTRDFLRGAKTRVQDEMGSEFDDVDWRKLDPRQYDPRRIIREALLDDPPTATVRAAGTAATMVATNPERRDLPKGEIPPYDNEAT